MPMPVPETLHLQRQPSMRRVLASTVFAFIDSLHNICISQSKHSVYNQHKLYFIQQFCANQQCACVLSYKHYIMCAQCLPFSFANLWPVDDVIFQCVRSCMWLLNLQLCSVPRTHLSINPHLFLQFIMTLPHRVPTNAFWEFSTLNTAICLAIGFCCAGGVQTIWVCVGFGPGVNSRCIQAFYITRE